jgi:hypothetical protein
MKKIVLSLFILCLSIQVYAADQKLTALTEDTAPVSADIFYMVVDTAGTPVERKITFANIIQDLTTDAELAAWAGTGNITTLGTIGTGVWNGTAIIDAYVSDTLTSSLFVGSGSTTNAIDLATAEVAGNLPVANLNSGTNASATTFWRGDGTWVTPSGSGDVTAAANLGDNFLIRGDGASKGVQNSGITVDDSDNITGVADLTITGGLTAPDGVSIAGNSTGPQLVYMLEDTDNGATYIGIASQADNGNDLIFAYPNTDPTLNQIIQWAVPVSVTYSDGVARDTTIGSWISASAETNSLEATITGIADAEIFIGDGADSGTFTTITGDVVISNGGVATIQANSIENSMMADNSVDSDQYVDGSIDKIHLSAEAKFYSIAVADLSDSTTPSVLTTAETTNTLISNYKATGADHVFTFPAAHAAANGILVIWDEFQVDYEPPSGTHFYLNGTAMANDEHIQNTADTLGQQIVYFVANINGTLTYMFESKYDDFVEETP